MGWMLGQSLAYVVFLVAWIGVYLSAKDNPSSVKPVARAVGSVLGDADRTLLVSRLPEEAAVYLPVELRYVPTAQRVLVIVNDRRGQVQADLAAFASWVPDGKVVSVSRVLDEKKTARDRWKVFELLVDRTSPTSDRHMPPSTAPATIPSPAH